MIHSLLWGPDLLSGADLWSMFLHFTMLSLLAIGGALTTAPEIQRWVVGERAWLTDGQFTASVALAQASPGPNLLFVAVVGWNIAGLAGVACTMLGTLLPSSTLAVTAGRWGTRRHELLAVRAFKAGMAPLTIGLFLASSWVLIEPLRGYPATAVVMLVAVAVMMGTKLSPLWPIGVGAAVGAMGWLG